MIRILYTMEQWILVGDQDITHHGTMDLVGYQDITYHGTVDISG